MHEDRIWIGTYAEIRLTVGCYKVPLIVMRNATAIGFWKTNLSIFVVLPRSLVTSSLHHHHHHPSASEAGMSATTACHSVRSLIAWPNSPTLMPESLNNVCGYVVFHLRIGSLWFQSSKDGIISLSALRQ